LPKCPTGIAGLDEITLGGLPRGRPTLVCGSAGCGKTLFGMEFLARGAVEFDEPGVIISFEESAEELTQNVRSLGFNLDDLVARKKIYIDHVRIEPSEIDETGDYDLEGLFVRLNFAIQAVGAKRVVLDTLEALFAGLSNQGLLRSELRRLFRWLKDQGVTAVITGERGEGQLTRHGLEEYISDCVILLDNRVTEQLSTRRLRIVKYRGSRHGANEYPFLIDETGIQILPITAVALDHDALEERISSGIDRLDAMLGGGCYRGSTVLVSGTAGTGKTSIATTVADASCRRGERCLYFAFEESQNQVMRNMRSIGTYLAPWAEQGLLRFSANRPTSYGLEMHLVEMYKEVVHFDPSVVIVDPISAFLHAGTHDDANLMVTRLVDMLKSRQITAVFTSLVGAGGASEQSEIGISSLVDTWVLLRSVETNAERNRVLHVLKSRGVAHSNQVREFVLTDQGIDLIDIHVGPEGVLTGASRLAQQNKERAAAIERRQEFERRQRELERKRRVAEAQIAAIEADVKACEDAIERLRSEQISEIERNAEDRDQIARARWADKDSSEPPGGEGAQGGEPS
jgi:circadian clock protein KaiC